MSGFLDDNSSSTECTFALTGEKAERQAVYTCFSCYEPESQKGCCIGCAESCHAGHDVALLADYALSYCDCGAAGCENYHPRTDVMSQETETETDTDAVEDLSHPDHILYNIDDKNSLLEAARRECEVLAQHSKETFWLGRERLDGLEARPRCALEALAASVFSMAHHQPHLSVGAEFWVQVKIGEPGTERAIDLHYDKDEEVASRYGMGIFPHVSTVTYLSDGGTQPTIVFENTYGTEVGVPIPKAYLTYGRAGKMISFNGSFLHGAPALPKCVTKEGSAQPEDAPSATEAPPRITFLVNVWRHRRPAACSPLPVDVAKELAASSGWVPQPQPQSESAGMPYVAPVTFRESDEGDVWMAPVAPGYASVTDDDEQWHRVKLPFVSRDAAWGIADGELGLYLKCALVKNPSERGGSDFTTYVVVNRCPGHGEGVADDDDDDDDDAVEGNFLARSMYLEYDSEYEDEVEEENADG